jgi:hypothetical protein
MSGFAQPGLYVLPRGVDLTAVLEHFPGRVNVVAGVADKPELLAAVGGALGFPAYARPNWDSFEECLNDLGWLDADARVLVVVGAGRLATGDPGAWQTALAVFAGAVRTHAGTEAPLWVLLLE